jgi:hypothetical protein
LGDAPLTLPAFWFESTRCARHGHFRNTGANMTITTIGRTTSLATIASGLLFIAV